MMRGATLLLGLLFLAPQTPLRQAATARPCLIREVRNDDGWVIPGVTDRAAAKTRGPDAKAGLWFQNLDAKPGLTQLTLVGCVDGDPSRIRIQNSILQILSVREHLFGSRPFAYTVLFSETAIEGGKRVPTGSAIRLFFYDPDGTGLYKVQLDASDVGFEIVVPEWVKRPQAGDDGRP
jgi:hypothetical protein